MQSKSLRNNKELIAKLCDTLAATRHQRSCDLIVPPGFDEVGMAEGVLAGLRATRPEALIAECAIDEVADATSFVQRLAEAWDLAGSDRAPDTMAPDQRLPRLFSLLPMDRPAILVLRRFHKLLDALPAWLLGALRTAEQQGRIRTLVLSPVSTQEMKQRWLSQGHPLVVSNYGDTHIRHVAGLIHPDDLTSLTTAFDLPQHFADYALHTSGGYPELFAAMARSWHDQGKPQSLNASVKKQLNQAIETLCKSFCNKLDPEGSERIFGSHVANLYTGTDTDEAVDILQRHEWRDILLSGNNLRCKKIGETSIHLMIEQTRKNLGHSNRHAFYEKAQDLYRNRLYSAVSRLLEGLAAGDKRLDLLLSHALIMEALCPHHGDYASIDSNWGLIPPLVRKAKKQASDCPSLDSDLRDRLTERYDNLAKYAQLISKNKNETRPIDRLSIAVAQNRGREDLALCTVLLLQLHAQSARSRSDTNEAVQLAMALPEQLFRVWALWELDLNYYASPPGYTLSDESRKQLSSPEIQLAPVRTDPSPTPFPSFKVFYLYCRDQAVALGRAEPFAEWKNDLQLMTNFRNDRAHAVTSATQSHNKQFLDLLDRWLSHTHHAAPLFVQRMTQAEILNIVQPLPVP